MYILHFPRLLSLRTTVFTTKKKDTQSNQCRLKIEDPWHSECSTNTTHAVLFDCSASFESRHQVNHLEYSIDDGWIQYNNLRTKLQLMEESCSLLKYRVVWSNELAVYCLGLSQGVNKKASFGPFGLEKIRKKEENCLQMLADLDLLVLLLYNGYL